MLKYSGVLDQDGFVPKFEGEVAVFSTIYQLILETTPGNAKYEVSLKYKTKNIS